MMCVLAGGGMSARSKFARECNVPSGQYRTYLEFSRIDGFSAALLFIKIIMGHLLDHNLHANLKEDMIELIMKYLLQPF